MDGETFYVYDGTTGYCYKVIVGTSILQNTALSEGSCNAAGFTTEITLGQYQSTSNMIQSYDSGDYCDGISADREASLAVYNGGSATTVQIEVVETSMCVYEVTLSGPVTASPTSIPTPVPTPVPTSGPSMTPTSLPSLEPTL